MNMEITVKKVDETEIPIISQLADKIWKEHYTPVIGKKQVEYMLQTIYSEDAQKQQMQNGQEYFLIYVNNTPTGYFSITKKGDECFLNKLYVLTEEHTKGIGSVVMKEIIQKSEGKKRITLTVNRQNYKAINFYFKHGFKIKSVDDFDIGNGFFMNDFVMEKLLS